MADEQEKGTGGSLMNADRIGLIRSRLEQKLNPVELEIVDESEFHKGHPGARDGRGHFKVIIRSPNFRGASQIARHRMVYDALDELMRTEIHALSLVALEPAQLND